MSDHPSPLRMSWRPQCQYDRERQLLDRAFHACCVRRDLPETFFIVDSRAIPDEAAPEVVERVRIKADWFRFWWWAPELKQTDLCERCAYPGRSRSLSARRFEHPHCRAAVRCRRNSYFWQIHHLLRTEKIDLNNRWPLDVSDPYNKDRDPHDLKVFDKILADSAGDLINLCSVHVSYPGPIDFISVGPWMPICR